MTIATNVIDGFKVEIEPNPDREGVDCFITSQDDRYTASLACAEGEGSLWWIGPGSPRNRWGLERPISDRTVERIRRFAERYGY